MRGVPKEKQIANFCTDLRIIWSKQFPDLTFGDIVVLLYRCNVALKTNAEILDILMDLDQMGRD